MRDEFKEEKELANLLDAYKIDIPTKKLATKQSMFQRFIRYLGSPAKDPLEKLTDSKNSYVLTKVIPLACGLFLAILQGLLLL